MNRFSVLYLIREQFHHLGCSSHEKAQSVLRTLMTDSNRVAVGIYDAKTELMEWDRAFAHMYNQASMEEKSQQHDHIVSIAQALRQRDSSWHPAMGFRRPSFFA